jgi:predicted transcriptional regulator of viral defense system
MGRYFKPPKPKPLQGGAAVLAFVEQHRLVRIRDLRAAGVNPIVFWLNQGRRVAPGVWAEQNWPVVRTAVAAKRVPRGVVCLGSALFLHGLASEPEQTSIALGGHAWRPTFETPPVRIVRFSGEALHEGIEVHSVYGAQVRVYGVAKTIADLFKYRKKVGRDLGISALRDALRAGLCSELQIWHWAVVCRVTRSIAPYLRALRRQLAAEKEVPSPPVGPVFWRPRVPRAWERDDEPPPL